jgi:carboxypeptidase family protein
MNTRAIVGAACAAGLLIFALPVLAQPTGSLTGRVLVTGKPPARPKLPVVKSQETCGSSVVDDRLAIGSSGGIRWAIVTIEGAKGQGRSDGDPGIVLDNHGCRFAPHVLVGEVGQFLEIHNSDPVIHNAHAWVGKETVFNVTLAPDAMVRRPLTRPGMIHFTCDVGHTWMSAYVSVTDHPFQTVTDAYGEYQIDDIPPGTYNVRVWHEELGTREHPVTIEPGGVARLEFTYPVPAPAAEHAR